MPRTVSKAFTREDGPPPPPLSRPPPLGRAPITPAGFATLQQELTHLRSATDPALVPRLEYLAARLEQLEVIGAPPEALRDQISFGARVTLKDSEGVRRSYQLVGPEELDATAGRVSLDSPLGLALVGLRPGDELTVERPRGSANYTVESVVYDDAARAS